MENPLSKDQEALRGKKIKDMSLSELKLWIDACDKMEGWIKNANKARRSWTSSKEKAEHELQKRILKGKR